MHSVTVVIPALNEAESIARVVRGIPRSAVDEIIVVDNGSSDETAACARAAGARVVSEPRRGYGRACHAGINALSPDCTLVVFLDGDGSDAVEELGALVRPIVAGTHEFVIGSRTRGQREPGSMAAHQVLAGRIAGWALFVLYGTRYTDMCPFRVIDRVALAHLPMSEFTYGWNLQMQALAARARLRVLEIPVPHFRRFGGTSKVSGSVSGTFMASLRIARVLSSTVLSRIREGQRMSRATRDAP